MHIHFIQFFLHFTYLRLYLLDFVVGSVTIDLKISFLIRHLYPFLDCIDLLDHLQVDLVEPRELALEILSLGAHLSND